MKKKFMIFLLSLAMVTNFMVGCGNTNTTISDEKEEVEDFSNDTLNDQNTSTKLHKDMTVDEVMAHAIENAKILYEDKKDYQANEKMGFNISLDGKQYSLPCKLEEFEKAGWLLDIELTEKTDMMLCSFLTKGNQHIYVEIAYLDYCDYYYETGQQSYGENGMTNFLVQVPYRSFLNSISDFNTEGITDEEVTEAWRDMYVVGVGLFCDEPKDFTKPASNIDFVLDGNITWGSTVDDLKDYYGEPYEDFEGSSLNYCFYDDNYWFGFNDGVLDNVSIKLGNINITEQRSEE